MSSGLCLFSAMLAAARLLYAKRGSGLNLNKLMIWGSLACVVLYVIAALAPTAWLVLVAFGLIGFCSSLLWTGTLIVAADTLPFTGALIFALLAGGGQLGIAAVGSVGRLAFGLLRRSGPDGMGRRPRTGCGWPWWWLSRCR